MLHAPHWNINNGYYNHGTLIVTDGNVQSGCGTGLVKTATAFPDSGTSLWPFTMDPADFAPGVVSIYNAFSGPDEGIEYANDLTLFMHPWPIHDANASPLRKNPHLCPKTIQAEYLCIF